MDDLYGLNLDAVEEPKDFSAVKAGTYRLRVEEIRQEKDNQDRQVINVRHSIVGTAETVDGGTPGGIFNTLYLHKQEALGFLRRFVEAHGSTWEAFKANRDVNQFIGAETDAIVTLETKNGKTGEDLASPRNRIGKYIVPKTVTQ